MNIQPVSLLHKEPIKLSGNFDNKISFSSLRVNQAKNNNTTYYFRNDLDWNSLKEYLITKYQNCNQVNTYVWGCSTGEEAYSLSMLFQDTEYGEKFFPIYAMDKSKTIIKENKIKQKNGVLLNNEEYCRIADNLHKMGYINTGSFIDRPPAWFIGDIKLKDCVTKPVKFICSDITKDLNKIDNNNSSVVMCRNMWPYINPDYYAKCAKDMFNNMKVGSVLIIGNYDIEGEQSIENTKLFPKSLIKAGFKPVDIAQGIHQNGFYYNNRPILIYEK